MNEITTEEASSTLVFYVSPQLHHLPSVSEVQETNSVTNMTVQLNVQPAICSALPASSEHLQSYVGSPVTVVEHNLQLTGDASSAERPMDVSTGCVEDVIERCQSDCVDSGSVKNALTVEPPEAVVLCDESVGQSKVSCFISLCSEYSCCS